MTAYWRMAVAIFKFEIQVCKGRFRDSKKMEGFHNFPNDICAIHLNGSGCSLN